MSSDSASHSKAVTWNWVDATPFAASLHPALLVLSTLMVYVQVLLPNLLPC